MWPGMASIEEQTIRRLDGMLLLVFRELLRQRRGIVAAERLGLSQSGVSHALRRLRDVFGDQLFVRRPYGLEPTRRALELAPQVDALIALAQTAVANGGRYDPESSAREFHIGSAEFMIPLLASPLIHAMEAASPNVSAVFRHLEDQEALSALRSGEIDLLVGPVEGAPDDIVCEPLLTAAYAAVAREGHSALDGGLSLAAYGSLSHVVVFGSPTRAIPHAILMPSGVKRRVVAVVPRYLTAFAIVAATDAIVIAPRPLAARYAQSFALRIAPLPFEIAPLRILAARKSAKPGDAGVEWLLGLLKAPATTAAAWTDIRNARSAPSANALDGPPDWA